MRSIGLQDVLKHNAPGKRKTIVFNHAEAAGGHRYEPSKRVKRYAAFTLAASDTAPQDGLDHNADRPQASCAFPLAARDFDLQNGLRRDAIFL
jgi:hypothetical protein